MIIILEGVDNTGKSTQIRNIKNYFNDQVFITMCFGNVKQNKISAYKLYNQTAFNTITSVHTTLQQSGCNLILDRSHLGELVYSKYRNYDGQYIESIDEDIAKHQSVLITLIDDVSNLLERDDGLSISVNEADKIYEINTFKKAHSQSKIKHKLLININDKNQIEVSNAITNFIAKLLMEGELKW